MSGTLGRRRLGNTGMTPCVLGLGCAWFGSDKSSDRDAIEGVRRAIELGIDFLDTSAGYGQSERRVGLALAGGWREKVYLETKTGTHPERRGDFSAAGTRWSVENSLRLLKTEYLDSVLIHDPSDIEVPLAPGACLDELLKMKEEGKVRHLGIGVRQHEFHRRMIETGHCEIVLTYLDYTLLSQSVVETTFAVARRHDVGVMVGTVLGLRELSGREPERSPRAHAMWEWCRDRGVSLRHLAIQFALAAPVESMVIIGAGTPEHMEEAYADAATPVPPEVWDAFAAEFGVGCT